MDAGIKVIGTTEANVSMPSQVGTVKPISTKVTAKQQPEQLTPDPVIAASVPEDERDQSGREQQLAEHLGQRRRPTQTVKTWPDQIGRNLQGRGQVVPERRRSWPQKPVR